MAQGKFPTSHVILAVGLATLVIAFATADRDAADGSDRFTTELVLDGLGGLEGRAPVLPRAAEAPRIEPEIDLAEHIERVKPGDNLAVIFKRLDLPALELKRLLDSGPLAKRLRNIYPGHELSFLTDPAGDLVQLAYSPGPLERLEFERTGDTYRGREVVREPEAVPTYRHAQIEHSLFVASQRAGLNDRLTMRLAQIFQWDVDFVLDIRKGDGFYILYEELYLADELVGFGNILAAEFVNRGRRYRAVRYVDSADVSDFYNPDGENMRKEFLRAPVEFSRISSNFNLKRRHPLFKQTMPHRGIDYAAPVGTPVLAAGDGKVIAARRNKSNGNYVVIRHGEQFQTKYLHLSKFARNVRKGNKVRQGQTIGYVGATGWATGPHLHYEFLVNGVHRNPRTIDLPKAKPIPPAERERFATHAQPILVLLDNYRQEQQLATAF